ncbi:MAG: outer membrane protein assembly factor BamB [Halomonas sp.]|uniref:outer membrane protein assembly factor BamB n=1 Tax=Halomonas TaxID=2745 RepID=UPI000486300B|nr:MULTISPECIES: outer membrane protein assembly factor BamB [Halomonas]NWN83154.1 outer membrane protein assembly factor BamB [Halomonas sp.]
MKPTFLIAALTGLTLLAGCAGNQVESQYPPTELKDIATSAELASVWREGAGDGLGHAAYPIAPARDGDALFAADYRGELFAFDADDGDTRWEEDLGVPVSSALTAVAGDLYLGTRNGEVLAVSQRDGSIRWRADVPSEVLAAPQPNQQLLIVQSVDGTITALDRSSGNERWSYQASQPSLTLRGAGTPTTIDPVTFAGFANGRLTALDNRNGQPLWERRIAVAQGRSDIERLVDLAGQPVLTPDGRLFVTSYNGRLVALEATRGEPLWARELSSYHTPLVMGDFLFVVEESGRILALAADSGDEVWRNTDLEGREPTSPAFADGKLVFGDFDGYLHLIDARSGEMVGRDRIDSSGIGVRPVTDDNRIHVLANDGTLETLDIR